jgi:hypothetical protein
MKKLEFKTNIQAPAEKVWNTLWDDKTYREWTSVFSEGSKAVSDWKQGSKILFVNEKNSGMVSYIEESRPYEYMSFRHMGMIKDGVEDLDSDETKKWAGAHENYTLHEVNGATELVVDLDTEGMDQNFLDYFSDTWPKALKKLKEIAERK